MHTSFQQRTRAGAAIVVLVAALASHGQQPSTRNLGAAATPAPLAFHGIVEKLEYAHPASSDLDGFVRVTFRVTKAVRGTNDGDLVTIEQWAGLWRQGQLYRVGQVLDVELYAPSNLALASAAPVTNAARPVPPAGVQPPRVRPQRKSPLRSAREVE